jgi:hypothetical protein
MVDDSLIKPIESQNILSVKSARDKDVNDKRKRQNNGQSQEQQQQQIPEDANDSEIEKGSSNRGEGLLDFRA